MFQGYDGQRIGLQAEWLIAFIKMHNKDHPSAEFKIGDEVLYNGKYGQKVCKILAVNVQKGGLVIHSDIVEIPVVEYAVTNIYDSLVYEKELKKQSKSQLRRLKIQTKGGNK